MERKITRQGAGRILKDLMDTLPREECRACECFQGFLVQLEIEVLEDIKALTGPLKVNPFDMHRCLGCDPCPPAEAFRGILD